MRATIAAKEAEWDIADAAKDAETKRRIAALVLSESELELAKQAGLSECEARRGKDNSIRNAHLGMTFARAVAQTVRIREELQAERLSEAQRVAQLEKSKERLTGEGEEAWKARVKRINKREKDRVRRANWRAERRYLTRCHGFVKPSSYSGTNRNNRRSQKSPEHYKLQDEIKKMRADLSMLEFMTQQLPQIETQLKKLSDLNAGGWTGGLESTAYIYSADCDKIRERYGLPSDIEDLTGDADVAQAYAVMESERKHLIIRASRHVTRRHIFTLWKNELESRIRKKHGM